MKCSGFGRGDAGKKRPDGRGIERNCLGYRIHRYKGKGSDKGSSLPQEGSSLTATDRGTEAGWGTEAERDIAA